MPPTIRNWQSPDGLLLRRSENHQCQYRYCHHHIEQQPQIPPQALGAVTRRRREVRRDILAASALGQEGLLLDITLALCGIHAATASSFGPTETKVSTKILGTEKSSKFEALEDVRHECRNETSHEIASLVDRFHLACLSYTIASANAFVLLHLSVVLCRSVSGLA
jgi:hypothetical protein